MLFDEYDIYFTSETGFFNIFTSAKHCFKWGFSQTVNGKISPKWGNIPKSKMLVGFFLPMGKNNPIGFFLPWDFSWDS
jgi:hypothetical protein